MAISKIKSNNNNHINKMAINKNNSNNSNQINKMPISKMKSNNNDIEIIEIEEKGNPLEKQINGLKNQLEEVRNFVSKILIHSKYH